MSDEASVSPADYVLLTRLADEFAARYRAGERPSLQEYIDRYPALAEDIREMFPAMVEIEQVRDDRQGAAGSAAPARPALGQIGDYRLLREVGRGGMGVVYEAEQVSLGRRVALKVLPRQAAPDGTILERFRREARAAARLHHTNIVPVYEVGQDGDVRFYAMQFIQGQGLETVIDELKRIRDRPGPAPASRAPVSRPDLRSRPGGDGPGVEVATLPDGVEVSQVVRSILVGRFGPDGPATAAAGSPRTALGKAVVGVISPPTGGLGGPPNSGDATAPGDGGPIAPDPQPAPRSSPGGSATLSCPGSAVLPGGTRVSTVESGRRAFYRRLAHIGRQIAGGLAYAHARGIVHRDIKPSNLLLDTEGVVWIADFGLAKGEEEGLTQSGDILGTLRYMAPERFRGQGDARADVYALGLTLYELLTLYPGFDTADRLKLIERINAEDPPRPRALDPRIPRDLETIVVKAIEKDPKARYQTAEALGEDLRRFLADEPILARQVTAAERYWRSARRNPVIAVLGGVLTVVLVVATAVSMVAASHFRNLAVRERRANHQSQVAQKIAVEARHQAIDECDHSRLISAGLSLDKGIALAEGGHAERGLLWMLEALKTAPGDAEAFRRMVRWNLGAWLGQVHQPLKIVDLGEIGGSPLFSPDGKSFAMSYGGYKMSRSTPVSLWDTATGSRLTTFQGCFVPFAPSPDGKVLVGTSAAWDRVLAVDLATQRELWSRPFPSGYSNWMALSPDGSSVLASGFDPSTGSGVLMSWEAATGWPRVGPLAIGHSMAMAPDGRSLATDHIEDGRAFIDLLEWPSGRRVASWRASASFVHQLFISPDGRTLFEYAIEGKPFNPDSNLGRIWDLRTKRPISPHLRRSAHAAYVPAGDRVLTAAGGAFVVRESATGRARGTGPPVTGLEIDQTWQAVHPDGRTVVSIKDAAATLWRIAADAEPAPDRGPGESATMAKGASSHQTRDVGAFRAGLRPDGRVALAVAGSTTGRELIRLSDPATGRPIGRPARHLHGWTIRALALSPDGRRFATASYPAGILAGEVRLWDAETGWPLLWPFLHTNYASALAFRPDGRVLAAGDYHGLVRLWDPDTGREVARALPQKEIVLSLAYSPDGRILAVGLSQDHTHAPGTRLWDAATHRLIGGLLASDHVVKRIEFRPDSRVFVAGDEVRSQLWDADRRQAIGEPIVDEAIGGFLPDGRALLTLGRDGSVKLRDSNTGTILRRLLTVPSLATCAASRGGGDLVAVGCEDGTVRLCDPAAAQAVGPPRSMRHPVVRVAFTADGRSIVAVDEAVEAGTWPVPEPLADASLDGLTLRVEARTGLRMEAALSISQLDNPAWRERLERLGRLDATAARPDDDPSWHEPMIREAEQVGNAFAAIWHLDRLIAARPDDWFLLARRARAWASSEKFEEAASDYRKAERLGSFEQVLDFQAHCVVDCTEAGRWAEALWYLQRLIAARPGDVSLHEDLATIYGKLDREADRQAELARVFELGGNRDLVIPRAEELGRGGRWAEAAGLLARCGRRGPVSRELAQAWGIACLKAGDRAGYREACLTFTDTVGPDPTGVWIAVSEASLLALGPAALDDFQSRVRWFEKRLSVTPAPPPVFRHHLSNAQGGLLLRAGRLDEAIARLNEGMAASKEPELPTDWVYLAVAHAQAGRLAEAREWLARLRGVPHDAGGSFWDLQELDLLRTEAESLLFDAGFPKDPFQRPGPR
jgi:serine/threonine protein kinase/WD40 repeat protein/tetratricopeptide (TPR) repeat protein